MFLLFWLFPFQITSGNFPFLLHRLNADDLIVFLLVSNCPTRSAPGNPPCPPSAWGHGIRWHSVQVCECLENKCLHVCLVWLCVCASSLHEWQAWLNPLCNHVWEGSWGGFHPVFSTPAITSRGNANGCFDSHGQGLKHLFYYVIHVWPAQPRACWF